MNDLKSMLIIYVITEIVALIMMDNKLDWFAMSVFFTLAYWLLVPLAFMAANR